MARPLPFAALLLLLAAPAVAQDTLRSVCEQASATPEEFGACALEAYETADADLHEVFRLALVRAKAFDEASTAAETRGPVALEPSLRKAQDDWTAFRDSDCDMLMVSLGGSAGGPEVAASGALCRAEKTLQRAQSLRTLMADY